MPRHPVTLVESSAQGFVAFISENTITVTDSTGKTIASTQATEDPSVARIPAAPGNGSIRAATFSLTGKYFAVCTNDKSLVIYATNGWTIQRQLTSEKRTNALAFDPSETHLLAGDKFGDCTQISIVEETPGQVLLGHVSIVCALAFTHTSPPFVLSCDRDEKLRISHYPSAYNIRAFGLGHTEFVTSVATLSGAPHLCLTGAGDATLRLWDLDGGLLRTVELEPLLQKYYAEGRARCALANSFEDRTAATQRYGVLRVRAAESLGAFIAVVERFPVVIVLPLQDGELGEPVLVDVAGPPTDVAPVDRGFVVAYAEGQRLADAYARDAAGAFVRDLEVSEAIARSVQTREVEEEVRVPSIFVWGNKMYLERPQGDNDDENDE
ncbi:WD repeat-containing protein 4 [Coemansia sp. RSA 2607]|nr:WD repeat-containing protein 4 [Coemansia sp. RSA 2607]